MSPRGNDAEVALHELADRYGTGVGNAEALIDANLAANTQRLRAATSLPRDEELTREARKDMSGLKGPNGEKVVSVAVRRSPESDNAYTVVVYRTEEGRDLVAALDEDGKTPVTGDPKPEPPQVEEEFQPKPLPPEQKKHAAYESKLSKG